jgi:hypothetical protein
MPVIVQGRDEPPTAEERAKLDAFVAAFLAKRGVAPTGTWRVPGVGYVIFYPDA